MKVRASLWPSGRDSEWAVEALATLERVWEDLLATPLGAEVSGSLADRPKTARQLREWRDALSIAWWNAHDVDEAVSVRRVHGQALWAVVRPQTSDDEFSSMARGAMLIQILDFISSGMSAEQTLQLEMTS